MRRPSLTSPPARELRAIQWFALAHLLGLVLFGALMAAFFWYLQRVQEQQLQQTLDRDIEWVHQSMRLSLRESREELALASAFGDLGETVPDSRKLRRAHSFLARYPEADYILGVGADRHVRWAVGRNEQPLPRTRQRGIVLDDGPAYETFTLVRDEFLPSYSPPFSGLHNTVRIELQSPVLEEGRFVGTVLVGYSLERLLLDATTDEVRRRSRLSLVDQGGNALVGTSPRAPHAAPIQSTLNLESPGHGIALQAQAYEAEPRHIERILLLALGGMALVSLFVLDRLRVHARRRLDIETERNRLLRLSQAMEKSLLTGIRVFDLEGRVTFVNPAFCAITGYPEEELLGREAPFPYWLPEDLDSWQRLRQMLRSGQAPEGGFEVELRRKDGQAVFVRMYVSPLIDSDQVQTGWITSMTDITEQHRAQGALALAHERFATVLDEIDAAVWVGADAKSPNRHLPLFMNRTFRESFGLTIPPDLARVAAALASHRELKPFEHYDAAKQRWFELRCRQIEWGDAGVAQLAIATDVTERHLAASREREHLDHLQRNARLMTMGEMASSLAHELNQPLAAISNYCMGMAQRLRQASARGGPADIEELLLALGKTTRQAERASMVIRRIRDFVRRSEPERSRCQLATIVADALALAEIDASRRGVRLMTVPAPESTFLHADAVLIEQVLLNLLKNAIEASEAHGGTVHFEIEECEARVVCRVLDTGPGLTEPVRARLFEPFFSTKREGMGIGLNLCRSILEAHGGRLWVESAPEGGCIFLFELPILAPALEPHPAEHPA